MKQWFIFYYNPTYSFLVVIQESMALTDMFSLTLEVILLGIAGKAIYCGH